MQEKINMKSLVVQTVSIYIFPIYFQCHGNIAQVWSLVLTSAPSTAETSEPGGQGWGGGSDTLTLFEKGGQIH